MLIGLYYYMVSLLCPFICNNWPGVYLTILMFLWGSIPILALRVEMFIALYSIYMVSSNFILLDFQ